MLSAASSPLLISARGWSSRGRCRHPPADHCLRHVEREALHHVEREARRRRHLERDGRRHTIAALHMSLLMLWTAPPPLLIAVTNGYPTSRVRALPLLA